MYLILILRHINPWSGIEDKFSILVQVSRADEDADVLQQKEQEEEESLQMSQVVPHEGPQSPSDSPATSTHNKYGAHFASHIYLVHLVHCNLYINRYISGHSRFLIFTD